jgi:hypothetical protein
LEWRPLITIVDIHTNAADILTHANVTDTVGIIVVTAEDEETQTSTEAIAGTDRW